MELEDTPNEAGAGGDRETELGQGSRRVWGVFRELGSGSTEEPVVG